MDSLASLVSELPYVSAGLEKVRSKPWCQPLGLSLSVTADILTLAGEAGLPVAGLVGTALKIGADLLSDEPAQEVVSSNTEVKRVLQRSFRDISKKVDVLNNEIREVKEVAYKTLDLVSGLRYKAGIEKIDAAYETLMDGANNLETTLSLFDNYIIELQTNAKQHLNPEKIGEYLLQLKNQKEYEKCASFFTYAVATRAKYLQMMSLYYTFKNDHRRVENEFLSFNADCKMLAGKLQQAVVKKYKPELVKVRKFSEGLLKIESKGQEPEQMKNAADPRNHTKDSFKVQREDTSMKPMAGLTNGLKKKDKSLLERPIVDIRNRSPSPNMREFGMASSFFSDASKHFDNLPLYEAPGRSKKSSSTSTSTSTSIINGRKVSKTTNIENGKETVLTYENDVLVKKTVNGRSQAI